jgi:CRP-like cAMP-binding protein
MHIDQIIDSVYLLPQAAKQVLKERITEVSYPKKHLLLRAGTIEKSLYFIKKGMVRAYAWQGNHEITFWFGKEGDTIISMKSYVDNEKGYENIELLEECELYELKAQHLHNLFMEHIELANWGRKFAEQELIKTEELFIARQFKTALERYKELLTDHPDLIQRVALGHIASYLGITQVSLSRIRAEIS